jgi:hypothetical protein
MKKSLFWIGAYVATIGHYPANGQSAYSQTIEKEAPKGFDQVRHGNRHGKTGYGSV